MWRYLRVTQSGLLRVDRGKIAAEAKTDGGTLLRTSDVTWTPLTSRVATRRCWTSSAGFRDLEQLDLRSIHQRRSDRLVTIETDVGTVVQRTHLDDKQQSIVAALGLPEPPRYYDFRPLTG